MLCLIRNITGSIWGDFGFTVFWNIELLFILVNEWSDKLMSSFKKMQSKLFAVEWHASLCDEYTKRGVNDGKVHIFWTCSLLFCLLCWPYLLIYCRYICCCKAVAIQVLYRVQNYLLILHSDSLSGNVDLDEDLYFVVYLFVCMMSYWKGFIQAYCKSHEQIPTKLNLLRALGSPVPSVIEICSLL
jgi:hypothetical protein